MKNLATYPTDIRVATPTVRAVIGGKEVQVISYTLERGHADPLSGGLTASTADIVIPNTAATVSERRSTPWSPAGVKRSDAVELWAGYNGENIKVFTGVVDSIRGGVNAHTTLECVDWYTRLDQTVTLDPLMAIMPPAEDGGAYRRPGVTVGYALSTILRMCDFYATPKHRYGGMVSVPANGSLWPEGGKMVTGGAQSQTGSAPIWAPAWWGQATSDGFGVYTPSSFDISGKPFEIQTLLGNGGTTSSTVTAKWVNGEVKLRVYSNRSVDFTLTTGGTTTTICSLSSAQTTGAKMLTARVSGSTWTLTTDTGAQATASGTQWPWSTAMSTVEITVPKGGTQIGGIQVGYFPTPADTFTPTASISAPAWGFNLVAMPAIVSRKASEVIKDLSQAELGAFWIDTDGVLIWRSRVALNSGGAVVTITGAGSILDLSWRAPVRSSISHVSYTWQKCAISYAQQATITVFQGPRQSVESGSFLSEVVSTPSGEDWVMVNSNLNWLQDNAPDVGGYHRGRRSWIGLVQVHESESGQIDNEVEMAYQDIPLDKINPRAFAYSFTVPTVSGSNSVEMRSFSSENTRLWPQWRNIDLPLIRAYGKISWFEQSTRATGNGGMSEFSHEGSWYVQDAAGAQAASDAARDAVIDPSPALTGVSVVPDFRYEVGDIVTLSDPDITGLNLTARITSISISGGDGSADMSLGLAVIRVNGVRATYGELEAVWAGANYAAVENSWRTKNYAQFEGNPLEKG